MGVFPRPPVSEIAFCEDRLTFFILARLLSADDNLLRNNNKSAYLVTPSFSHSSSTIAGLQLLLFN